MLLGLLTGHINLHYMLHKMRRAKDPSCRRYSVEKETSPSALSIDPDQIKEARLSSIVAFGKGAGLPNDFL